MAIYDGILGETASLGERQEVLLSNRGLIAREALRDTEFSGASLQARNPVVSSVVRNAISGYSFADVHLFNRIWVVPSSIDAGFIIDEKKYTISIWNAFSATKQITAISVVNEEGTELEHEALPIAIAGFGEVLHTLKILASGPVDQETIYTYTIDSTDYKIEITGTRIVLFSEEPDWKVGVRVSYQFNTVVEVSVRYKEQRRPLLQYPSRAQACKFVFMGFREQQRALSLLKKSHGKVLGVPLYVEPLTINQLGTDYITVDEDISKYFNLNNLSKYVILIDYANNIAEAKEIQSIAASTITFKSDIKNSFNLPSSIAYPLMLSYVGKFKIEQDSGIEPELARLTLDFKELIHAR